MAQSTEMKRGCHVARTISGNSPLIIYKTEENSTVAKAQGLLYRGGCVTRLSHTSTGLPKAGAMVYLTSTHAIVPYPGWARATGMDQAASLLMGLLLEDCTGVATHKVAIAAAVPDTVFETALTSVTATTTATTTASLIGWGLTASTTSSRFYLSRTNATSAWSALNSSSPFQVVDVVSPDGTYNGRVQFIVRYSMWTGKTNPTFT